MIRQYWKRMSLHDWAWLARSDELRQNLYMINPDTLAAEVPSVDTRIPWCVLLLLGSYSKKHRFLTRQQFKPITWRSIAKNLTNRIKWAWRFKRYPVDGAVADRYRMLVKRDPRAFEERAETEVEDMCKDLALRIKRHFILANKRIARDTRLGFPAFVTKARGWLREHDHIAVQSDKDGVMVLLHNRLYETLIEKKFVSTGCYRRVNEQSHFDSFHRLRETVQTLCKAMRSIGLVKESRECAEVFFGGGPGLASTITANIKTHKLQVECRLIHASFRSSLAGFSTVLHRRMSQIAARLGHLCVNSRHLANKIDTTRVPRECVLLKIDVKEFYLSGDHKVIIEAVLPLFGGGEENYGESLVVNPRQPACY